MHQSFNGMNVMMQQSIVGGYQQSLIEMAERFLPVSGNTASQAITNIGRHDKFLFTGILTQVVKYFINPNRSLPLTLTTSSTRQSICCLWLMALSVCELITISA